MKNKNKMMWLHT